MSRVVVFVALAVVATLAAQSAEAAGKSAATPGGRKIYKCADEKGEIFYSDHYDPERCKSGGSQLNDKGMSVKTIERQATPEERAAAEEKARQDAEEKRKADELKKSDSVLLQSFVTEEDLTHAHEKELRLLDSEIKANQLVLKSQERNLTEMLALAADAERANQAVPPNVVKNIAVLRKQVEGQREHIAAKQSRRIELEVNYEAQLKRFRELHQAGAPESG
jgi:hypothetical protein